MRAVTDDQGRVLTDGTGQEVGRHDFEPFGEEIGGPSVSERRLFTSAERDVESGFDYLGARFYWPDLGRFTTSDPAGLLAENLYVYVMNDPLMFIDPTGMQAQTPDQKKREDPPIFKVTIIGHLDTDGWGDWEGLVRQPGDYQGPTMIRTLNVPRLPRLNQAPCQPVPFPQRFQRNLSETNSVMFHAPLRLGMNLVLRAGPTMATATGLVPWGRVVSGGTAGVVVSGVHYTALEGSILAGLNTALVGASTAAALEGGIVAGSVFSAWFYGPCS